MTGVMANGVLAFLAVAAASALATLVSLRFAARAGLADDPAAAPHRKLQPGPVPAVGGIAILVGLLVLDWTGGIELLSPGILAALLLAFLLGLVDDRRRGGLSPLALLLGQSVAAIVLVASGWRVCGGEPWLAAVASFAAVLVAVNALNTFDNADGAATSLGIVGFSVGAPLLAAPLVGFLPWNLLGNRDARPRAYLGNSGSHLLGVLLVLDPVARLALCLPLLDLLRLVILRAAAGGRPWLGDRRHLAHRLQKAGLGSFLVAAILALVGAPVVVLGTDGRQDLLLGFVLTCALFVAAVRFTPSIE